MDLRHPLRALIPSRDWAVLEVLAATHAGLGASRIAQLSAEGSRSGQASILDRLVHHGLVLADPANNGFTYRLNRDHLLAPAVLLAADLRAELIRRLTAAASGLAPHPLHVSVFGSFARGEAGDESDIDLLLIGADDSAVAAWDNQLDQLQDRVQRWTGNRCTCLAMSLHHLRTVSTNREPIVDNWRAEGLLLVGEPLDALLDTARSTAAASLTGGQS